jgi:hypothetical protein
MSIVVLWIVTPCSLLGGHQRFVGTYYLHIQGYIPSKICQPLTRPHDVTTQKITSDVFAVRILNFTLSWCPNFLMPA